MTPTLSRTLCRRSLLLTGGAAAAVCVAGPLWAQHKLHKHTATTAKNISLGSATRNPGSNQVSITVSGSKRTVRSNGIPNHKVGSFRHQISAQNHKFRMPAKPKKTGRDASFGFGEIRRGCERCPD